MKFTLLRTTLMSLLLSVKAVANSGLITLNTSNVIGSTTSYDSRFLAEYILNNQSGVITETNQQTNDVDARYW
ncbi:MAG TPA: hypothetical protein DIS98_12810 [Colwellia sp.]|nr:hypothetical protein [Colwellia sp.]|tara:strand:- start:1009 stop:1227 length:219 start_codon:yes stop_codon:yes gene_type:complete